MSNTKKQTQLKNKLVSAQTIEETLKTFKEIEANFKEAELGKACFVVAQKLSTFGHTDVDQILSFAKRSLTILTATKAPVLLLAIIFRWTGNFCFDIHQYENCLFYFTLASNKFQAELENEDDSYNRGDFNVLDMLLDVEQKLCSVNKRFGMDKAVVDHAKKVLELKEKMLEEGCFEVGKANKEVCEALFNVMDIKGALPYCEKALEIYKKHLGDESVEVAKVMMYLGIVYLRMNEVEKAIEMNRVAVCVFKKVAPNSAGMVAAEGDWANVLVEVGRAKEAVVILKRLVTYNDMSKHVKMNMLISLSNALCCLEKFDDAKKHLKAVQKMFDRKEVDAVEVAIGCGNVSNHYERMKDFASAISFLKRALELPELPLTWIPTYFTKFFKLMCLSGKEKEGILYMEGFVGKLKRSYGPKHIVVGEVYSQVAAACSKAGQKELAAKVFRNAKDAMDVLYGPYDLTSLKISHDLSVALADLERFDEALGIEEEVAKGVKVQTPSELGFVQAVIAHLSKMKKRVADSPITASSQSKDEGGLSAKIAKCNIADDGKGLK